MPGGAWHADRTVDACVLTGKRARDTAVSEESAVRLKWVRESCGSGGPSLRLESFELVDSRLEQPQPASQMSIEAAALLASLAALPSQLIVTATVPLRLCDRERDALLPLTPSLAQCQEVPVGGEPL